MRTRLLDADAGLGRAVAPAERALAAARLSACVHSIDRGTWDAGLTSDGDPAFMGVLVLDGFLIREVRVAGTAGAELLGPGDVLRPWDDDTASATIPTATTWHALTDGRVAVLDGAFARAAAPWPCVGAEVMSRLIARSRWLSALLALSHAVRLEPRIVALFWHLADRWGNVVPAGVEMPLPLRHATIGALVGGQRPSISRSLARLGRSGLVSPLDGGGWLLHGDALDALARAQRLTA